MSNILIVCASNKELKSVKKQIKNISHPQKNKIFYLASGIGNYQTIQNFTSFLEKNKIDFVINIGICWRSNEKPPAIQVWRIKNIHTNKELIVPIFFKYEKIESIACSENICKQKNFSENFVDMESFGIEFVCSKYNIPRIILKVPYDEIWKDISNIDFEEAADSIWKKIDINKLIQHSQKYIQKIPKEKDRSHLKQELNLSFQQYQILKHKIKKREVLNQKDFNPKYHLDEIDFTK